MTTSVCKLLSLFVCIFTFSSATFVHQVSENEFEIGIEENGVRITENIRYENGLKITVVPSHHHISGATYVYDQETVILYFS